MHAPREQIDWALHGGPQLRKPDKQNDSGSDEAETIPAAPEEAPSPEEAEIDRYIEQVSKLIPRPQVPSTPEEGDGGA